MKRIALCAMVFSIALTSYSQSKKNGTIYEEHPAITIAEGLQAAFVAGDTLKVASYLAEDFKAWNGNSNNPDAKGTTKEQFINQVKFWNREVSYLSVERFLGTPDALEYSDDSGVWVQTWEKLKGVHTKTGSKINMPVHRLYQFNEDNKIVMLVNYSNDEVFANVGRSFDTRKNGQIYDQHEYINKVKLAFAAFENGDYETCYSVFAEDARFNNASSLPGDKAATLDEVKASNAQFVENYEIKSIDMVGYPDYLHYERGDIDLVQSWWTFRLVRKSDQKKIVLPAFYTHQFNDDGKISFGNSYINMKLLDD